jgi:HEAT repeat protein
VKAQTAVFHLGHWKRPVADALSKRDEALRRGYLEHVKEDVSGRFEKSLHRLPFVDLGVEHEPAAVRGTGAYYDPTNKRSYDSVWAAFTASKRSLLLLGHPGAGKTTELLHIAEALLREAEAGPEAPIPVIANMSSFVFPKQAAEKRKGLPSVLNPARPQSQDPNLFIEDWFVSQMAHSFKPLDPDTARRWLHEGRVALLLDGLDEFDDERRADLVKLLNETFLGVHVGKPIVICCRVNEYEILKAKPETTLALKGAIELQPLGREQVRAYLAQAGATRLMQNLQADEKLEELSRTPLMLSILALAYGRAAQSGPAPAASLSDTRFNLFEAYVAQMLQRQARRKELKPVDDVAAHNVPPERYAFGPEAINRCLGWLAITLSVRMRTSFAARGLTQMLLLIAEPTRQWQVFWVTYMALGLPLAASLLVALGPTAGLSAPDWLILLAAIAAGWLLLPVAAAGEREVIPALFFFATLLMACVLGAVALCATTLAQWMPMSPYQSAALVVGVFLTAAVLTEKKRSRRLFMAGVVLACGLLAALQLYPDPVEVRGVWLVDTIDREGWVTLAAWTIVLAIGLFGFWTEMSEFWEYLLVPALLVLSAIAINAAVAVIVLNDGEWIAVTGVLTGIAVVAVAVAKAKLARVLVWGGACALVIGGAGLAAGASGCVVAAACAFMLFSQATSNKRLASASAEVDRVAEHAFEWLDGRILTPVAWALLAVLRKLPFRRQRFLDSAVGAFLLKRSSGDVEFVHRFLRDYFALRELRPQLAAGEEGRLRAIEQLGYQGQAALDTLVEIAGTDEAPRLRAAALLALIRNPSPEATRRFGQSLDDRVPEVREALLRAIAGVGVLVRDDLLTTMEPLGDGAEMRTLVEFFPERTWESAVRKFAKRMGEPGVDVLLQMLEESFPVRSVAAIKYLVHLEDDRIVPALIAQLDSRDPPVRREAVRALGERADVSAITALEELRRDPDAEFTKTVETALAQLRKLKRSPVA